MSAPGGSDASVSVSSELAGRTVRIMYASSTELQALELVLQDPTTGGSLSLAPGGHGGLAFELGIDVNTGMEGKVALVPSLTTNASLPASEMATLTMVDVAATEEAPGAVCVSSPLAVAEDSASVLEVDAGVSACKGQSDGTAPPASPPAEQSAPPPPPSPATANNDSGGDGSGGGGGEGLSAGAIFGIVIGSTVGGVLLIALVVFALSRRSRDRRPSAISASPSQTPHDSDFTNNWGASSESAAGAPPPVNRPSRGGRAQFVELT